MVQKLQTSNIMLIQPTHSYEVLIRVGQEEKKIQCHMLSLSETLLELSGYEYINRLTQVTFHSNKFRGSGVAKDISFERGHYVYFIQIQDIHFLPGFLVDTEL